MTAGIPPHQPDARERSLVDDVRALAADSKTLVQAELAYQKSRAVAAGSGAKSIVGWGIAALVLGILTLHALVFGLLLSLAFMVGPWKATAIVVGVTLLAAALCGLVAKSRVGRLTSLLGGSGSS